MKAPAVVATCTRTVASGFPPDDSLRAWLISTAPFWSSREKDVAQRKLHEFVYALLTVTRTALETIVKERQGELLVTASQFRCQLHYRYLRATQS